MKYYIELTLIPDAEISPFFIWSKLYTQIHLGLVEMQDDKGAVPIGISFPGYVENRAKDRLGQKLRLFAVDEATLTKFDAPKWLAKLTDYVHCTSVRSVPIDKIQGYVCVSRYRPHLDITKIAQRFAQHKGISFEAALEHCKQYKQQAKPLPYIQLKSLSGNQLFKLAIKQTPTDEARRGTFGTYGLTTDAATVPHW